MINIRYGRQLFLDAGGRLI